MDGKQVLSNPTSRTPLLTSLKQCVKKIEVEVGELKKSFKAISSEEDESKASFSSGKILNATKETNFLRHDCEKFKSSLKSDIQRTKCYYYDMEDLTLDIEDEVAILEKHLKNFGYEPPDLDASSSPQESKCEVEDSCCENTVSEADLSMTPQLELPTILIPQKRNIEEIAAVEKEPVTPELGTEVIESEKKVLQPRHVLVPSPLPFPNLGSPSKLGDVARRLDF